jgi:hypothetical protein
MAFWVANDLTEMFDTDAFGTASTYTAAGQSAVTINGSLRTEYIEIEGVETSAPIFVCATTDVSSAAHGDLLTSDSVAYTVRGVQDSGYGTTMLILETV